MRKNTSDADLGLNLQYQSEQMKKHQLERMISLNKIRRLKNDVGPIKDNLERYEFTQKDFINEGAIGGSFRKMAAVRALGIMDEVLRLPNMARDRGLQERIESSKIAIQSKTEFKNMLVILMGAALVNEMKQVFETAVSIVQRDVRDMYPLVYEEAIIRTDNQVRLLLNLVLHASIVVHNVK